MSVTKEKTILLNKTTAKEQELGALWDPGLGLNFDLLAGETLDKLATSL